MSNKAKTLSMIRDCARKMKLAANTATLDVLDHDESELDAMRLQARDADTIDAMSDDSVAFFAVIRDYHVYRDARALRS